MKIRFLSVVMTASVLLVAGCGGGSGSNLGGEAVSPPPAPSDSSFLQITPAAIELTMYEGSYQAVDLVIKSSKPIDFSGYKYGVSFSDAKGIIDTSRSGGVSVADNSAYSANIIVSNTLAPGVYSTQLQVRLCEDRTDICAKPVSGYTSFVPVNVVVKPLPNLTNLTTLTDIPQVGAWTGLGGNARHTNYVPITLDPAKFSQRWSYKSSVRQDYPSVYNTSVNQDGRIFVAFNNVVGRSRQLVAIDEASGVQLWQITLPDRCGSSPVLANGKIFTTTQPNCADSGTINAYDQKTGKLLYESAQLEFPYGVQPLAVGDDLYVQMRNGDYPNVVIAKIDARNGTTLWKSPSIIQSDPQLSADAQNVYGLGLNGKLYIVRLSDGSLVSDDVIQTTFSSLRAPMLGLQGQFYATAASYSYGGGATSSSARYSQFAYDSISKKNMWSAIAENDTTFQALAGTTLYRIFGQKLEARNANDGTLLWTSTINVSGPLLVTDNLVFVNDSTGIVAIDLASHQPVWSFPYNGNMSLSSKGVLYITGYINSDSLPQMIAINLK